MDFTFFYTKEQLNCFAHSRFNNTILWPYPTPESTNLNEKPCLSPGLETILEKIASTKRLMDPIIEASLQQVRTGPVGKLVEYSMNSSSWKEKSFLMRASVLASGRKFTVALQKAACAIELLGMSFCLKDDLLDESSFYGSKSTTWKKYGYKETICLSEIIGSIARGVLIDGCVEAQLSTNTFKEVVRAFKDISCDTYISQFMDIESEKASHVSEDHYFEMISRFPGTLYAEAINIACLLSGTDAKETEKLKEFARLLAMANQIRDDLIEIIGEEDIICKRVGADILQKKKRLPLLLFLQRHTEEYREDFLNVVLDETRLKEIMTAIQLSGVVDTCILRVQAIVENAIEILALMTKNEGTRLLEETANSVADFEWPVAKESVSVRCQSEGITCMNEHCE